MFYHVCGGKYVGQLIMSVGQADQQLMIMTSLITPLIGWKWGCPSDPATYFGSSGWRVLGHPTWTAAAESFGFIPEASVRASSKTPQPPVQPSVSEGGRKPKADNVGVQYVFSILK